MKRLSILSLFILIASSGILFAQDDEDLDVLTDWLYYTDAEQTLYRHLAGEAFNYLEKRNSEVLSLKTNDQWKAYQQEIRNKLRDVIGSFPEKTPLNPRLTGTLERPDFTVEKMIYESQPGFFVTALLMIPSHIDEPAPAIIYTSGHTANGFRSEVYQHKMINLVKKGFIVLAYDPPGQGERIQYFDDKSGGSYIGGATTEHSYAGAPMFLTGSSLARYMIWDGIRAVDYLQSRSDVDPNRIGITGRSGGGTQASYLAAFDDRLAAVVLENYITSMDYLLKSRGPQDAEQNFYHGIASGIDHADILLSFAPKPSMIIATTRDFFSIQGTRETFEEVKRFYETVGKENEISMVEDDHGHGSTPANREAMYAFFQEHLNMPGSSEDLTVEIFTEEELQVTETGQVASSLEGETLFTLHKRESRQFINQLASNRKNMSSHIDVVTDRSKVLSGYREPTEKRTAVFTGRYTRNSYDVEKYFISGEGDYPVPFLMFRPHEFSDRLILYLHPEGKSIEAGVDGEISRLAAEGYTVVVPDLPGIGEMGPGLPRGDSYIGDISYNIFFAAVLTGRSIPGLRAGDVNRLIRTVTSMEKNTIDEVTILAKHTLTPEALHAAAFNKNITNVVLVESLVSYESIIMHEEYDPRWIHSLVPGALRAYDLPDLAAVIAPRRMLMINPVDQNSDIYSTASELDDFEIVKSAFLKHNVPDNLDIENFNEEIIIERILKWLTNVE